jgi:hypothetical protein
MKSTILIVLALLLITSCETEFAHTYVIKNNTDYDIQITGFDKIGAFNVLNDTSALYTESLYIPKKSEIRKVKQAGFHSEVQGIFDTSELDSLSIQFESLRIITYACNEPYGNSCSGKYNLMNYEESFRKTKTGKSSGKQEYTYIFEFNESDFENTEVIVTGVHSLKSAYIPYNK